jgi:hypothetical protein
MFARLLANFSKNQPCELLLGLCFGILCFFLLGFVKDVSEIVNRAPVVVVASVKDTRQSCTSFRETLLNVCAWSAQFMLFRGLEFIPNNKRCLLECFRLLVFVISGYIGIFENVCPDIIERLFTCSS